MNLSENLKRIRKENNLSQEQLADKLGVSRQSVSKWESNLAYPEMDKVLQICKMFNLNIDELLNQDLKEVNETKQSKNNINKFVDDFLDYITKTIDMFSSMRLKDKIKCLFEQLIIVGIISLVLLIIGEIILNSVWSILSFLPDSVNYMFYNIICDIYLLLCLVLGISLVLHIFKVRYLDYYIIIKENKNIVQEIDVKEESNNKEETTKESKKDNKKFFNRQKETIIIREPKHSGYKFISSLVKFLLMLLKFLVILIGIAFCISLIVLFDAITLSFLFLETGLLFAGAIIVFISCVVINLIILNLIYNFIVNKKSKSKILSIAFIFTLIMLGIGSGIFIIGFKDFTYVDNTENSRYIKSEETLQMKDNLYFVWLDEDDYIETNSNDVKIVITHSKYMNHKIYENENGHIEIYYDTIYGNFFDKAREFIENINNKELIEYYNFDVKVYTSAKNIKTLKQNKEEYNKKQEEYYNELNEVKKQNQQLEEENYKLELEIENLNDQVYNCENEN